MNARTRFLSNMTTSLLAAVIVCVAGYFVGAPLEWTLFGGAAAMALTVASELPKVRRERRFFDGRRAIVLFIVIPLLAGSVIPLGLMLGLAGRVVAALVFASLALLNAVYFLFFDKLDSD